MSALSAVLSAPVAIAPPSGFRWSNPPIALRRVNGVIRTTFDITSVIPAVTKTYYVNPVSGSDANAGTSAGSALQKLSTALAKSDVDQIIITGLAADYVALGSFGWNNTQPTRSVSIINRTGFRFNSVQASSTLPTWTVNGSFSNVYQATSTTANSASVVDLSTSSVPTYTDRFGNTKSLSNVPRRYRTLIKVGSISAVSATAGTWFNDGTNTYVRAHDDRNLVGDTKMLLCNTTNNGRFPSVNNCVIYVEGIDFVGGKPFFMFMTSTVTGTVLALNGCSFQGGAVASSAANGLGIQCFGTVYSYRCACYDNGLDGFNYHSFESDGTTSGTSPSAIEIECVSMGNGTTGSAGSSDNASTSHDFCNLIRVNCVYPNSDDRVMVDINSAHSWNLGCFVGQAITSGTTQESISIADSGKMWIDTCYAPSGASPQWGSLSSAVLSYFASGAVVNRSAAGGTVQAYSA